MQVYTNLAGEVKRLTIHDMIFLSQCVFDRVSSYKNATNDKMMLEINQWIKGRYVHYYCEAGYNIQKYVHANTHAWRGSGAIY